MVAFFLSFYMSKDNYKDISVDSFNLNDTSKISADSSKISVEPLRISVELAAYKEKCDRESQKKIKFVNTKREKCLGNFIEITPR